MSYLWQCSFIYAIYAIYAICVPLLWRSRDDFTNILRKAFTCTDLKSTKKTDGLTVFFVLLGSLHIKSAHEMLVKLTPHEGQKPNEI